MPDLGLDVVLDEKARDLIGAKFSDETWELNVRATRSEFR